MPKTIIRIKTWRCPSCDYAQDFDPAEAALMKLHFPGVLAGDCPACSTGQNPTGIAAKVAMAQETNPAKLTTLTVMGVEDIETEIVVGDAKRVQEGRLAQTEAEKTTYRAKRTNDIALAITEARKKEYVP